MINPYHLETDLKDYVLMFEQTTDNYVGYVFKFPNGFGTSACTNPDVYPTWIVNSLVFCDDHIEKSSDFEMPTNNVLTFLKRTFER